MIGDEDTVVLPNPAEKFEELLTRWEGREGREGEGGGREGGK